jgi:hypothetical protein
MMVVASVAQQSAACLSGQCLLAADATGGRPATTIGPCRADGHQVAL